MDRQKIKDLALELYFRISDEEADDILSGFGRLEKKLELLEGIDTEGVTEMSRPFDDETEWLREDLPEEALSAEEALSNCNRISDQCVSVPREIRQ